MTEWDVMSVCTGKDWCAQCQYNVTVSSGMSCLSVQGKDWRAQCQYNVTAGCHVCMYRERTGVLSVSIM